MIKSVNNYPVSQLFDTAAQVVYVVPRYQREFTWGRWHLENLFDDILEHDPGYFLGSIICINQTPDPLSIQKLELVDGQQRLTTLSLLFASVYIALKNREDELEDEQKFELINLKRKLVLSRGDDRLRVIPQFQNNNYNDYRAVLAKIGIISPFDGPPNAGNRRIFRSFNYFIDRIDQIAIEHANALPTIMDLLDKIYQASMVKIDVASHSDAYTLFASLNNRGLPLTPIDLIKNKLLAQLESYDPGKIDSYYEQWNNLLNYLGDDYNIQERFFRQYYNAFKEELRNIYHVPVATRSNLIHIYERLINDNAQESLQKILAAGKLYSIILLRHQDEDLSIFNKPLQDLERIQGAPSYLLMLYLLARREKLQLGSDHLKAIIKLLVRFFVRRNLTDTPPTRDLTRIFMAIIDKLVGVTGQTVFDVIKDHLISVSSDNDIFKSKLYGPIYEENVGVTRFILCALAEQGMNKEMWTDLWRVKNKQFVWTIEHIFPQGEKIPQSWIDMMAEGDEQRAKEYQQKYAHKLGNLTISGFNSALGTKSFEDKRDRKDEQGLFVGYKNGLKINEVLAVSETWSADQIEERTQTLVDQAMLLFQMTTN